ncbi:putative uncharacterized protein DDB_G0282133 [Teleopsis dalmanni]|uniref:putative uncharacterized protein DDB_G0282133 n=1 Tax=Teleopsis dalmanni TaxID=139649 RepID=UPI0018CD653B|nr:putative uncharacterized protein DDB_G0282133 [Teleopsis dalmanni]
MDDKVKQKGKSEEDQLSSAKSMKKSEKQFQEKDTQTEPIYRKQELLNEQMDDKVKQKGKSEEDQLSSAKSMKKSEKQFQEKDTQTEPIYRKQELLNEQMDDKVKQKGKSEEDQLSSAKSMKKSEKQFQEKDTQTEPIYRKQELLNEQMDDKVKQKGKSEEDQLSSAKSMKKSEKQFQEKDTQTEPVYKKKEVLNEQMDDKVKQKEKSEKDTQTECDDSSCKFLKEKKNSLNEYSCDDKSCEKKATKVAVENDTVISDAKKGEQVLPRENKNKTESKEKIASQPQGSVKMNNKSDTQKSNNNKEDHCNCCKCKEKLNAKNEKENAEDPVNVSYGWVSWFAPGDYNYSNWMVDEMKKKNLDNDSVQNMLSTRTLNDDSLTNNMMKTGDNTKDLYKDNSKDEMNTYSALEKSNKIQSNRFERKLSDSTQEQLIIDTDLYDNKISHTNNNENIEYISSVNSDSNRISISTQTEEWVQDEEGRYSYIPYTPYRRRTLAADEDANRHEGGQYDRNSEDDNENVEYESARHNIIPNKNGSNKIKPQYLRSTDNNIANVVSEKSLEYKSKSHKKIQNGKKINEPMLKSVAAQYNLNSSNNEKSFSADFIQKKSEKIRKYLINSKRSDNVATCSYSPKQKNQNLNITRSRKSQFEGCTYPRKRSLTRPKKDDHFKEIPFKCPIKPANERLNSLSRQCPKLYTRRESVVRSSGVPSTCPNQSDSVKENNLRQAGGKGKEFVCSTEKNNLNSKNVNSSHRIEHCYFQETNSSNYDSKPTTSRGIRHRTPTIYKFNQKNNTFYIDDDLKQDEAYPTSREYYKFANFSSEMNTTPTMPTLSMQERQAHIRRYNNSNERNNTEYSQQCGKPMYNNYDAGHAPMPPTYKSNSINQQINIPSAVNFKDGAMSQRQPSSGRVRF